MKTNNTVNPLQLTRMIFDYWLRWVALPDSIVLEGVPYDDREREGLLWYNGYNATFWYLLNVRWYEMNDKLFANSGCKDHYCEVSDFDPVYIAKYYS